MITQERLKEVLKYKKKKGVFVWRKNDHGVKKGRIAGTHSHGYIIIMIDGKFYRANRLAFLYMLGYFPENQVDHINRVRDDDRWCNLREVSVQCNTINSKVYSTNKTGVKGVWRRSSSSLWYSVIVVGGKHHILGTFKSFTEAVAHRLAAEQCLDWHDCDSDSTAYNYIRG